MTWLFLAVAAQLAGTAAIFLDKAALDAFVRSPTTILLLASGFNLATAASVAAIGTTDLSASDSWLCLLGGALFSAYLFLYFTSLQRNSALSVTVLFQLVPAVGLVLAALTGEAVTARATFAIALVVAGALAFSVAEDEVMTAGLIRGRRTSGPLSILFQQLRRALPTMLPAIFLLAASAFTLGRVDEDASLAGTIQWSSVGVCGGGLLICALSRDLKTIGRELRVLPRSAVTAVLAAESLALAYQLLTVAALSQGPAAYVLAVEGVQPLMLLVLGTALSFLLPKWFRESTGRRSLIARLSASIVILSAVAMLAGEHAA